jgi:hypothetical protein
MKISINKDIVPHESNKKKYIYNIKIVLLK